MPRRKTNIIFDRDSKGVVWRLGDTEVRFDIDDLPKDIQRLVLLWGLNYLLTSRTSHIKDDAERLKAAQFVFESLKRGMWKRPRISTESDYSILVAAICELKGWSEAQAREFLSSLTPEQQEVLVYHPRLAPIYARLRSEAQDADDLGVEL